MIGILIVTLTAFVISIILVIFTNNKKDYTEEIESRLPGLNCGACGFAGCKGMASEIMNDPEVYKKCRILRNEKLKEFEDYLREKKLIK